MNYVIDDNNNRIEAFDKEETLAVLEKAIEDGSLAGITADSAFVTKLKCCVTGKTNKVGFVTQAKYNEMATAGTLEPNALYFIIDDTTCEDLQSDWASASEGLADHEARLQYQATSIEQVKKSMEYKADESAVYLVEQKGLYSALFSFVGDLATCTDGIYKGFATSGTGTLARKTEWTAFVTTGSGGQFASLIAQDSFYTSDPNNNDMDLYIAYGSKNTAFEKLPRMSDVSAKSDRPTSISTSSTISKKGLYALVIQIASGETYVTAMASVYDLSKTIRAVWEGSDVSNYVKYNGSTKKFESENSYYTIVDIRLVAEY
jgi:hypothetical protein